MTSEGKPMATKKDPRVTKRRVTMRSVSLAPNGETVTTEKVDYVPDDVRGGANVLDAYVAKARELWQFVEVSDEPDAGPGGYHGQTHIPADCGHPLAGQTFASTEED